ncbi:hypothetical protein QYM36_018809 [Artemia franciscana]|uniref:Uncharacterized protein n=1 Tax=Artemia franciscana TaxID=6661 RepID=A0AA88KUF4_ARTSF|nr:hypothetical protein QYM36_018809 [Artemia franciscana]
MLMKISILNVKLKKSVKNLLVKVIAKNQKRNTKVVSEKKKNFEFSESFLLEFPNEQGEVQFKIKRQYYLFNKKIRILKISLAVSESIQLKYLDLLGNPQEIRLLYELGDYSDIGIIVVTISRSEEFKIYEMGQKIITGIVSKTRDRIKGASSTSKEMMLKEVNVGIPRLVNAKFERQNEKKPEDDRTLASMERENQLQILISRLQLESETRFRIESMTTERVQSMTAAVHEDHRQDRIEWHKQMENRNKFIVFLLVLIIFSLLSYIWFIVKKTFVRI